MYSFFDGKGTAGVAALGSTVRTSHAERVAFSLHLPRCYCCAMWKVQGAVLTLIHNKNRFDV